MDYREAVKHFTKRSPLRRRIDKLNNTWLHRASTEPEERLFVRLFKTDIITFNPDGSFEINLRGYFTATTTDRLRRYLPKGCYVWTERRPNGNYIATVHTPTGSRPYSSQSSFTARGEREDLEEMNCRDAVTIRHQVHDYAKKYLNQLVSIGLPAAHLENCSLCRRVMNDDDDQMPEPHYLKHLDHGTMPAGLLLNAVRAYDMDLERAVHALCIPNRYAWRNPRTRREALERTEAALMGLTDQNGGDPRGFRKVLRMMLETYLLEQLGFEHVQKREGLFQGMHKGMKPAEVMGWG